MASGCINGINGIKNYLLPFLHLGKLNLPITLLAMREKLVWNKKHANGLFSKHGSTNFLIMCVLIYAHGIIEHLI